MNRLTHQRYDKYLQEEENEGTRTRLKDEMRKEEKNDKLEELILNKTKFLTEKNKLTELRQFEDTKAK